MKKELFSVKKATISLAFAMILSVILTCFSSGASDPKPTTNKGAVCSQILNFGDVYVPVEGRDQVDGVQGLAIAGNHLYTAVTRKGYRAQDGSRPSLYTTLFQTDLKTMEQKTIVTDYYDDPNRIGIGHANDMTAVTDKVNGTTYTYILITRYLRSGTLLRITSDGVIDKTAVIVWKGATDALQEEIASDRMNTSGLAFTSAKDGIAQLLIANKNKFYKAEIDLREMKLSGKLQEAFTLSEEAISEQIEAHFGDYGQKYDEGKGSGWGYQGISYDRNTDKMFLPITVTKDVNNSHEYRAAVLVYDKDGALLPSEGFAFRETSMEIEGIDFYGSYLYWDAICYEPIASDGIPEGNRVFRMWTKANFTFDKSTDADSWTYNKNRISAVSVSDGILSFTPAKVTDGGSPWLRRGLRFSFPQADMFKIKFRIQNCDGIDGKMPKIRFHVSEDAKNWTSVSATATTVGEWYVAAVTIPNAMKEVNVKYLEVMFNGINGKDSTSRISVDYIYVGPQWVVPDGHSYGYKASKNPTTSATGTLTGTCSACKATTTLTLPKLNPTDYSKTVTKAATCTAPGTDTYTWKTTAYGTFRFTAVTEPKGHREVNDAPTEPTCTAAGSTEGIHCEVCGLVLLSQESIPATGHTAITDSAVEPTCTESGLTEGKHCKICGLVLLAQESIPATGHTDTAPADNRCDRCGERIKEAVLRFRTISLKGNIAINYYMDLSDEVATDKNAYMLFTLENGKQFQIPATEGEHTLYQKAYYYVFSCAVSAKEMTDTVICQFFWEGGQTEAYTYSVKTYADRILASNSSAKLRDLIYAMLNYGAASQIHFEYHTERLANAGQEHPDYTAVTVEGFPVNSKQGTTLATYAGASLLLTSETTLRIFFTVDSSIADQFTVSYKGEVLPLSIRSGKYYADIPNISAKDLDEYFTLTIFDGIERAEVRYAPLSYCASIIENAKGVHDRELQDVAAAMYLYNQGANAYFAK